MDDSKTIRVALAGNPNSGKTSIFNALTGAHQRVGNYPGVTVEKREGSFDLDGLRVEVIDLPGTYSLTSFSPEERVAQDELLERVPELLVVVVDSTALKRSLVVLAQLMQLGLRLVLCLNMSDEAKRAGQELDVELLEQLLGFPVLETVAHRAEGTTELKRTIASAAAAPPPEPRLLLGERIDAALAAVGEALEEVDKYPASSKPWVATKLLLDDHGFVEAVHGEGEAGDRAIAEAARRRKRIEAETGMDISLFVTHRYYGFVDGLLRETIRRQPREDARALSDRIDAVLANRLLGLPFFLLVMYAIFWIAFTLGEVPMGWIEAGFASLGRGISSLWPAGADSPLRSLLVDGIIGGVGGVVVFLPNIVLLFVCLAFLEDTGYMARAAFLTDSLMHRFGLHGKSFIPMMTGFGCSIPGIMATRTLDSEQDRLTTMLVLPLMSCGARLPIWMLLIPAFFPAAWRAPMLWTIYMIGIVLALLLALLLRSSILRGEDAPFVMELPPYRLPTLRAVGIKMAERSWLYLRKAGTIILAISIVMWAFTTYPKTTSYEVDAAVAAGRIEAPAPDELARRRAAEEMRGSIAGWIGRAIEPLIAPLGFDWKIGIALVGAFAAKEIFVAQMGVIYALGEVDEGAESLRRALRRDYSRSTGFSLMLFLLIATPCMATLAVTRRESGSWRWALLQMGGLTLLGYLVSLVFYQLARLIG